MKSTPAKRPHATAPTIISYILHAASIVIIIFLVYKVNALEHRTDTLTQKATELNMQSLQFNARTNNLKGCWQNNDLSCPENKYFDGSQLLKDK